MRADSLINGNFIYYFCKCDKTLKFVFVIIIFIIEFIAIYQIKYDKMGKKRKERKENKDFAINGIKENLKWKISYPASFSTDSFISLTIIFLLIKKKTK